MPTPNLVQEAKSLGTKVGSYLTFIPVTLSTITAAVQFAITPKHKGRFLSARFHTHTPGTATNASVALTPSIGGVAVTGGVVALTLAGTSDRGEITAGTTVTALNTFSATDTITWTGTTTTAFTGGDGMLEMELVNDDTANAIAGWLEAINPD